MTGKPIRFCSIGGSRARPENSVMPVMKMRTSPVTRFLSLNIPMSMNGFSAVRQWTMNTHRPEMASSR